MDDALTYQGVGRRVLRVRKGLEEGDRLLVERVARGDGRALGELYESSGEALFRYLFALAQDREVAEELLQDTLVAVWRGAHTFRGRSKASTWMWMRSPRSRTRSRGGRKPARRSEAGGAGRVHRAALARPPGGPGSGLLPRAFLRGDGGGAGDPGRDGEEPLFNAVQYRVVGEPTPDLRPRKPPQPRRRLRLVDARGQIHRGRISVRG